MHGDHYDAPTVDLCWQDYCPCDSPTNAMDSTLCRNLKGGLPMDEEMMALGAGMRDARKELDEFEAEHGSFDQ